ncbi:medium-chain acyl-CoA ligase ACSF2, mitochondrial-like isoform X2 [Rhynchophorus ferrugineus]|uniref:medium-chain acyl-CoA ligase ACSF2, mitochondrial-like isoform X2 n=1 Tax=Rhynchophorus ferrugineus TaxID=354439 RepID=UPI003FCD24C0
MILEHIKQIERRLGKPFLSILRNKLSSRRYHKLSYIHNPGTEPLKYKTVGSLLQETANKFSDRLAIIAREQNQKLSFREVLYQADRLAAGLKRIGLVPGDRVGIWAPNLLEWYLTYMACARGGYVLVNINPAYQPLELEYCVNKVGVKCLISPHTFKKQNYYQILSELSPELASSSPGKLKSKRMPSLQHVITISDDNLRGTYKYNDIVDYATSSIIEVIQSTQSKMEPDQACHIQFTSGTTGQPKAVIQTHFQLTNNSYFIGKRNELDRKHHNVCVQVPFFHAFGTVVTIGCATNHGATLVVPSPGYEPDKSLDAIRDEKCSVIYGTPTMYIDLITRQKERNEDISLEIAVSGGSSCSPHLFHEMKNILGVRKVKSVFGLTEATAVVFQSLYDDEEYEATSTVGYLSDHLEAKLIDEEGQSVPLGCPGELCVRGYCTTLGYYDDDQKTQELIGADKWLKTGDQFMFEENGYGRIVGRLKEMIIRGGENIFPKEIEDCLNTHPDILEAHVIGIPHERLGEEVCACVKVLNESITLDNIRKYCKGKLAHFKIPSALRIVDSFPKTASGKIQKYQLLNSLKN